MSNAFESQFQAEDEEWLEYAACPASLMLQSPILDSYQ